MFNTDENQGYATRVVLKTHEFVGRLLETGNLQKLYEFGNHVHAEAARVGLSSEEPVALLQMAVNDPPEL